MTKISSHELSRLDGAHQFSISRSVQIVEVSDDASANESHDGGDPSAGPDHGFLWRTNAYWRFEHANDGTFVEFQSISLSRDVPTGWGWLIEPFIRDVPRESLLFTLRATRKAVLASSSMSDERSEALRRRP
jgi:hypothetical protein